MSIGQHLRELSGLMVAEARRGKPVLLLLRQLCPKIHRQIRADGKHPSLLSFWGRSSNLDENVGQMIVPVEILSAIGELAGVPMFGRFVHAGLTHTYGYLFSMIETPYGFKGDRWVKQDLERGFGMDRTLLGHEPSAGTLLGNLTHFLGRIVFAGSASQADFDVPLELVADGIRRIDYHALRTRRIVEVVTIPGKSRRKVKIYTDLVKYPHPPADSSKPNTLLIYSIQIGSQTRPKLITTFPVTRRTAKALIATVDPERKVRVRLRYNAYVPGLFGKTVWGRRRIQ